MKSLTYKIITNFRLASCYKINICMSLNNTWSTTSNTTQPTRSQRGTLWPRLRIHPNKISQPGLNVVSAKSTAQTTEPECLFEEQFHAPGRTEQGRGRGVKWFTQRRSIISLLRSYVWGSRLNTAQLTANRTEQETSVYSKIKHLSMSLGIDTSFAQAVFTQTLCYATEY